MTLLALLAQSGLEHHLLQLQLSKAYATYLQAFNLATQKLRQTELALASGASVSALEISLAGVDDLKVKCYRVGSKANVQLAHVELEACYCHESSRWHEAWWKELY